MGTVSVNTALAPMVTDCFTLSQHTNVVFADTAKLLTCHWSGFRHPGTCPRLQAPERGGVAVAPTTGCVYMLVGAYPGSVVIFQHLPG